MKKVTLGDVCNKAGSNIAQKDLQENEGKYPIYGASGLIKKVDFYQQELPYIAVVKDGAGIGRTMLLPGHSSVIGTVQYILPIDRETVDLKYLYYAIVHMNLSKYFSGATIPHIYYKDYKKEPLRLPELEKQREIAIVFQRIDELIAKREQQLKGLDGLVKSRFIELFGDPVLNDKNWKIVKIGDIVTDVRYGTSKPAVEGGKYPYIRMNNLTLDGKLDLNDLKYIDIPDDEIDKCVVKKGDVLFNRTNSLELVGKTALFDQSQNMVIAGYIIRVRLNKQILPEIFVEYMNLKALKNILRSMAKGAVNQANINAKELQSIKIYIPDMVLQEKFVEFINQTDKSKYYNFTSYKYCVLAANLIRQEWMLCQTLSF